MRLMDKPERMVRSVTVTVRRADGTALCQQATNFGPLPVVLRGGEDDLFVTAEWLVERVT